MSEQLPPDYPLNYEAMGDYGNGPGLVKLAGIFNTVLGGLTMLQALYQGVMVCVLYGGVFSGSMSTSYTVMGSGATTMTSTTVPASMPATFKWAFLAIYGGAGAINLLSAVVELAAGVAFLRRSPKAIAWGIAAVVLSFVSSICYFVGGICCLLFVIPLGCGVFTLVILCMAQSRQYLRRRLPQ